MFVQLGFVQIMNKQLKQRKHANWGSLVRYLRRDEPDHVYVKDTSGAIKLYRSADFHPYFVQMDPTVAFAETLIHARFQNTKDLSGKSQSTEHNEGTPKTKHTAMESNRANQYQQDRRE